VEQFKYIKTRKTMKQEFGKANIYNGLKYTNSAFVLFLCQFINVIIFQTVEMLHFFRAVSQMKRVAFYTLLFSYSTIISNNIRQHLVTYLPQKLLWHLSARGTNFSLEESNILYNEAWLWLLFCLANDYDSRPLEKSTLTSEIIKCIVVCSQYEYFWWRFEVSVTRKWSLYFFFFIDFVLFKDIFKAEKLLHGINDIVYFLING
jgi:hypothetical protein